VRAQTERIHVRDRRDVEPAPSQTCQPREMASIQPSQLGELVERHGTDSRPLASIEQRFEALGFGVRGVRSSGHGAIATPGQVA
jgi:hypothetical protein